jgi:exosortase/archaeosortase family protein
VKPKAGLAIWGRVALFFAVLAALAFLGNIELGRRIMIEPMTRASVAAARLLINGLGGTAQSDETLLLGPGVMLDVKDGCNGVIAMILFTGAVVAHEATPIAKLIGLAIGIPVIWVVNLLRIVSLYVVEMIVPSMLEFFHIYFFQTLIIICVAFLWYAWAMRFQPPARRAAAPPPEPSHETSAVAGEGSPG